jgi:hypothetical protein
MHMHPSFLKIENPINNMIFYLLKLQMPLQSLQTKIEIHYKQKWIIKISPNYKPLTKYKIKINNWMNVKWKKWKT